MAGKNTKRWHNVFRPVIGLLGLSIFVFSFVWTNAAAPNIDAKIKIIREKYTPSTEEGPFWTPNDWPRNSLPDDKLVPYHETTADLKMYPLNEWIPTQQRDLNPAVRFYTASFFQRPPDWISTGIHGNMIELRGSIGVWAAITIFVRPRNLPDQSWTDELNLRGKSESVVFGDNTNGMWIKKVRAEDSYSIQPAMRQQLFRLTPEDFIIEAELRASYPRADGKLQSAGIPTPGKLDPKAVKYYEKILKTIVENMNPQPIILPRPEVINIKNCEMDPYWVELKYGDKVTFKNLDSRQHTLYGYNGNDDTVPPFQITVPANGEKEFEAANITPQMWGTMWCDRKMSPHIPLMTPAPVAGEYFRQPEFPVAGNELLIKDCRPFPYYLRVEKLKPIKIRNLDNKPHRLTFEEPIPGPPPPGSGSAGIMYAPSKPKVTTVNLPAKGSATKKFSLTAGYGIAGNKSISCDGSLKKINIFIADPDFDYTGGSGL